MTDETTELAAARKEFLKRLGDALRWGNAILHATSYHGKPEIVLEMPPGKMMALGTRSGIDAEAIAKQIGEME